MHQPTPTRSPIPRRVTLTSTLTKSNIYALPEGSVLASSVLAKDNRPALRVELSSEDARATAWSRVRELGIQGCRCSVFNSWADYEDFIASIKGLPGNAE